MVPTHIVAYHGTSSTFLDAILRHGFDPVPEIRPSRSEHLAHLASLPGTYVAMDFATARHHAATAVGVAGGEAVVVTIRVPIVHMIPDEDEILSVLAPILLFEMGFDEEHLDKVGRHPRLPPISIDTCRKVVASMDDLAVTHDAEATAVHLLNLLLPVLGPDWSGDPDDVYVEFDDGHGFCSPPFVRRLTSDVSGLRHYRTHMDLFARSIAGAGPDAYPCGLDACRGRILSIGREEGDAIMIAAGIVNDPVGRLDLMHLLDGTEIALPARHIRMQGNAPRRGMAP